jgi:Fur family transcriptional regulator, peroxide stress response regulator
MKNLLINKLKARGLKLTPQRRAIIEAFAENVLVHPSASTIYEVARKKRAGISLSTIYYTLNEFSKKGIINVLEFEKMDNRYEGNTEVHIHLVCKRCQNIIDIFPRLFNPNDMVKNVDFLVTDTRFEYYGYCAKCRERKVRLRKGNRANASAHKK